MGFGIEGALKNGRHIQAYRHPIAETQLMSPCEYDFVVFDIKHEPLSNAIFLFDVLVDKIKILDMTLNIELVDFLDITTTLLNTDARLLWDKRTLWY